MLCTNAREALQSERSRLIDARDALALHAGPDGETQRDDIGELSGMDEHLADVATETFEREVDLTLLHAIERDLADIEAALVRIVSGRYGRCEVCGGDIGEARLRAVPATRLCLDHQIEVEMADAALRRAIEHSGADIDAASHLDLLPVEDPPASPEDEDPRAVEL